MFLLYSKMKREMKNFLLKWKKPLLWLTGFVLLVLCWQVWDGLFDAGLALAAIVPGMSGGKIVSNEPLTTDIVREGSPSLLRSEVDKRIVKIRPMSTPIDQLSRWNGSRKHRPLTTRIKRRLSMPWTTAYSRCRKLCWFKV